jgi:putative membrane protein
MLLKKLLMNLRKNLVYDISFVGIIYLAGIIGIRVLPDLFLKTSFISIIIPLFIYLFRLKPNKIDMFLMLLVYLISFFSEWIGVCFGYLFGDYIYGNSLGYKLDGVPLVIGANWLLLCLVSRDVVSRVFSNKLIIIVLSSILMVSIDFLIEPLSNSLDFWTWNNNTIPFSNYVDWFLIALLNQSLFSFLSHKKDMFSWSLSYLIILVLFFLTFYF